MAKKRTKSSIFRPIGVLFRRFHYTFFFVFVVASLSVAVILVNQTLEDNADNTYTSPINAGTIDQATLERIQSLHTSSNPTPPSSLPQGRINPFAE